MGCTRMVLDDVRAQLTPDDIALRETKARHEEGLLAVWEHGAGDFSRQLTPDPEGLPAPIWIERHTSPSRHDDPGQ